MHVQSSAVQPGMKHTELGSMQKLSNACPPVQEVIGEALVGASPELLRDLSVHVCFICLLHLANENSLRITGVPSLHKLTAGNVALPAS